MSRYVFDTAPAEILANVARHVPGHVRQGKAILKHTTGQTPALQCECAPYAGMEVGVDGEMIVCMDR